MGPPLPPIGCKAFVQRRLGGVSVWQTLHQHYTQHSHWYWGECWGGVLGECWANTHPSTFPLYKGCPAKLGGVSVISLATIRNFIRGEMAFLSGQAAFSLSPANRSAPQSVIYDIFSPFFFAYWKNLVIFATGYNYSCALL